MALLQPVACQKIVPGCRNGISRKSECLPLSLLLLGAGLEHFCGSCEMNVFVFCRSSWLCVQGGSASSGPEEGDRRGAATATHRLLAAACPAQSEPRLPLLPRWFPAGENATANWPEPPWWKAMAIQPTVTKPDPGAIAEGKAPEGLPSKLPRRAAAESP